MKALLFPDSKKLVQIFSRASDLTFCYSGLTSYSILKIPHAEYIKKINQLKGTKLVKVFRQLVNLTNVIGKVLIQGKDPANESKKGNKRLYLYFIF